MQFSWVSNIRLIGFLCCLAVLGVGCKKKAAAPPPPPEVQVITVEPTNVPIHEEWIATLDGFVNAQIRAQVTGYLMKQNYAEGSRIRQGDLLFEIDPRPFQAVLDQALARQAQDEAQLGKAELDVKRYTPLAHEEAISQEQLDDAIQAKLAAVAQVTADKAAVETAKLNLGFTEIRSPVDGLAGVALAQIGDLVGQSGNILTTVSTIDPVKVYFQVSEQSYMTFWQRFITSPTASREFPLELIFPDGTAYPRKGKFFFANRQVNPSTGTLEIVGTFPNPDYVLRPGQTCSVRAETQIRPNTILVPQRAVTELQDDYQVAVVDDQNQAHVRSVKVGAQIGRDWIIEDGLSAGDHVVVEGTQKAKEGVKVNPKPYSTQTSQANGQTNSGTPPNPPG